METAPSKLSDADLIVALGNGTSISTELAKRGVRVDRENIYKMKKANRIWSKWRFAFRELARDSGIELGVGFLDGANQHDDTALRHG